MHYDVFVFKSGYNHIWKLVFTIFSLHLNRNLDDFGQTLWRVGGTKTKYSIFGDFGLHIKSQTMNHSVTNFIFYV